MIDCELSDILPDLSLGELTDGTEEVAADVVPQVGEGGVGGVVGAVIPGVTFRQGIIFQL